MIETRNLTKRYGNLIAANDITLKLAEGDVFGFIGPNGSGKTTTMRMIRITVKPTFAASRSTRIRKRFVGWWDLCRTSLVCTMT